jgi:hypothetical protein
VSILRSLFSVAVLCGIGLGFGPNAIAQPAAKVEAENLVPPGGAAFDVPVHAGEVCILSFPGERMAGSSALASSADFEIKAWGNDGVAVRATGRTAAATLALATVSGAIKVNVRLHVVPAAQQSLTLVRFKAASAEEAFEARVTAEVAKRAAPLEAELARTKQAVDIQLRERADLLIAERLLKRTEILALNSHERNSDNVIAHVERAIMLGDDGYVFFDIENRGGAPFRLARAIVSLRDKALTGPARLFSSAIDKDPRVLGVVPAGTTAHGIVVVRGADQVRGASLEVELADTSGNRSIRLARGIVLK